MELIIFFISYSFLGWILESVYKTVKEKKFINSGFLTGPFCPIYGFGALLAIQLSSLLDLIIPIQSSLGMLIQLIIITIFVTAMEYLTSFLLEKLFHCTWWDYSEEPFNLNGRVCIRFSVFWGILCYIFIDTIHPMYNQVIVEMPLAFKSIFIFLTLLYLLMDTFKSVRDILSLQKIIFIHYRKPLEHFSYKIAKYKRLYIAFPKLNFPHIGKVNQEIRGYFNDKVDKIKEQIRKRYS